MGRVVIGVDPHKRSNTALVLDTQERVLARQRFNNDRDGYRELKRFALIALTESPQGCSSKFPTLGGGEVSR